MRTTLTLDDDVVAELQRLRRSRGGRFREIVNDALRRGLKELKAPRRRREPFRTRVAELGRSRLANIANIAEALVIGEGEAFK